VAFPPRLVCALRRVNTEQVRDFDLFENTATLWAARNNLTAAAHRA